MKNRMIYLISAILMVIVVACLCDHLYSNVETITKLANVGFYYGFNIPGSPSRRLLCAIVYLFCNFVAVILAIIAVFFFFFKKKKGNTILGISFLMISLGELAGLIIYYGFERLADKTIINMVFYLIAIIVFAIFTFTCSDYVFHFLSNISLIVGGLCLVVAVSLGSPFSDVPKALDSLVRYLISLSLMTIGVLNLVVPEDLYTAPRFNSKPKPHQQSTVSFIQHSESIEDKLLAIKNLRDKSLITEEEYNQKRKEILDSYK